MPLFCEDKNQILLKSSLISHIDFNFPHQNNLTEIETKEKGIFLRDIEILMAVIHQSGY